MTTIIYDYFNWLVVHIEDSTGISKNYSYLLSYLLQTEFRWLIPNDKNRALDGHEYRDLYANGNDEVLSELNNTLPYPCSVLEMLVALSVRCEFDIMHDPYLDYDRCHYWFWKMIENLGLGYFTDDHWDEDEVSYRIWVWMDRQYDRNGKGSPFPLEYPGEDCRKVEIWSLLNRWLSENYEY